jgi:hypothetical protein
VSSSFKILPIALVNEVMEPQMETMVSQTSMNQLLQLGLPSLLLRDLLFDGGDLDCVLVSLAGARSHHWWRGMRRDCVEKARGAAAGGRLSTYQVRWFAINDELLLLQVLEYRATRQYAMSPQEDMWPGQCQHVWRLEHVGSRESIARPAGLGI